MDRNLPFTAINATTGEVIFSGTADDPEVLASPGIRIIHGGRHDPGGWFDVVNGYSPLPSRPTPHHHFDYTLKQWVDPRTLQDHKDAKWVAIKKARSEATSAPLLTTSFGVFDADEEAMGNIKGTIAGLNEAAALGGGPPPSVTWTLADNTSVTLTRRQLSELAVALLQRGNAAHETARTLRTQISAATTAAEVEAVTWPTT